MSSFKNNFFPLDNFKAKTIHHLRRFVKKYILYIVETHPKNVTQSSTFASLNEDS